MQGAEDGEELVGYMRSRGWFVCSRSEIVAALKDWEKEMASEERPGDFVDEYIRRSGYAALQDWEKHLTSEERQKLGI